MRAARNAAEFADLKVKQIRKVTAQENNIARRLSPEC